METVIGLMLLAAALLALFLFVRKCINHRREMEELEAEYRAMTKRRQEREAIRDIYTHTNPNRPYPNYAGYAKAPAASAAAPSVAQQNSSSDPLLYGALGYALGSMGASRNAPPDDPIPAFVGGGGESGGAGASASWDSGSSSSDSTSSYSSSDSGSSSSYDSGSSSSSDSGSSSSSSSD